MTGETYGQMGYWEQGFARGKQKGQTGCEHNHSLLTELWFSSFRLDESRDARGWHSFTTFTADRGTSYTPLTGQFFNFSSFHS
jgi:hypothetical protein